MTDLDVSRTVHGLFEAQARRTPHAVAVEYAAERLAYAELNERADRLARALAAAGAGQDRACGLLLERTPDLVQGMLGTLKAGGAYLPLDPAQPPRRLSIMLADAGAAAVLTTASLRSLLPADGPPVILLDDGPGADGTPAGHAGTAAVARQDNLAYILFTSGSTGRPKGVMIEHRNVISFLDGIRRRIELGPGIRMLQFAGIAFDSTVCEIFGTLAHGGTVVGIPPGVDRAGPGLAAFLDSAGITTALLPPSLLAQLPDHPLPALHTLVVGGETVPAAVAERWGERRFLVAYGPSETTLIAATSEERAPGARPPIGRPLPGVQVHVLAPELELVQPGTAGELFIGGGNLARGYLGNPALTAERFLPDPFGAPGARLYRTGDIGRLLPDGQLDFIGRADAQVKVRGHRVELGEVEAALGALPGVRDCAVVAHGEGAGTALVAFITGTADDQARLRRELSAILPQYMIPALVVPLEVLPAAAHGGKVDRAALRAMAGPALAGRAAGSLPVGWLEQCVAEIWNSVLGTAAVGRDDAFTDLGGNSLQALGIIARLGDEFGRHVSVPDFFAAGTVAALAGLLHGGRSLVMPELSPSAEAPGRASFGQQRLWVVAQRPGAAAAYNICTVTRLRGRVSVTALRAALAAETQDQEVLRTGFELRDDGLTAVPHPDTAADFAVVDVAGEPEPDVAAWRLATELARQPFDLSRPPLLRTRLIRVNAEEHLLVCVLAHVIGDGWSIDALDRRLAARYRGERPARPALRYGDFAAWQHRLAESGGLDDGLRYWRTVLDGAPREVPLPYDLPRPGQQSFRGGRVSASVPGVLLDRLTALAGQESATPYAVFLTALGVLVTRIGGASSVLIGSPVAGRPSAFLEEAVGFFANTVPIRVDVAVALDFRQILRDVAVRMLSAFEYQYVPFEWIVREHRTERDDSRQPLVQLVLAYQGRRRPNAGFPGLASEPLPLDNGTAKFDLIIEIEEVSDGLVITAEYNADVFVEATARRLLGWYVSLLDSVAAEPDAAVRDLRFGGSGELAVRPARTPRPQPGRCLHELFAARAAADPARIAVTDRGRPLSYGDLDHAASRLARRLRHAGAGAGTLVGVCAERSAALVVAVLGVLKSGAAYLPLDPAQPRARIIDVLADSGCTLVTGHERFAGLFPPPGPAFITVDGDEPDEPASEGRAVRPDDLAYVIYTSGSTGRPKGVMVSHASVVRLFQATAEEFRPSADDVWTLFHSAAFDFSVWELWGALLHGGRLVIVPYALSRDPEAVLRLLSEERVTVLSQTPSAFRGLIAAARQAGFPATALRLVVFGGERLEPPVLGPWLAGYGDTSPRLVNMYGITETTVHVTLRDIGAGDVDSADSPIGRPIDDLSLYLLDEVQAPVPAGAPGEVYVAGPGVSYGYLGRPSLTAQRFVPDPFGHQGSRMYRSGDLAILRSDGDLVYLGRADDQVQLRGFRIEPGEVSAALLHLPDVRDAAVLLRPDADGEPQLVAYVVPDGATPTADELRAALAARLPAYMVPTAFAAVSRLPLTVNGKLDRAALPDPRTAGLPAAPSGDQRDVVPPRNETERALAEAWREAMAVEALGVHDDFFALGGDSIIAIRVVAGARRAGLDLTIQQLYEAPTVAGVARLCDAAPLTTATGTPEAVPSRLPETGSTDSYPCSAMQVGIVYECEITGDPTLYHDLASVRLAGYCEPQALRRALDVLSARHDVLRTAFNLDAYPVLLQHVQGEAAIPLRVRDTDGDPEQALRVWWATRWQEAFDLSVAPLARCDVHRHQDGTFDLALSVHHAVVDGWSLSVLVTDLLCAYEAELGGSAVLPPLPAVRFRDFVELERGTADSARARDFWLRRVAGPPPAPMAGPIAGRGPDDAGADRAAGGAMPDIDPQARSDVPDELITRIRRVADRLKVPQKSVYLAAHLWALGALTGQSHAVTGVVFSGRPEEEGAELIAGLFLNCLPIGVGLDGGSWADLVTDAFAAERDAMPHRRFPLAEVQAMTGTPPFEAMFNFADFHGFRRIEDLRLVRPTGWWFSDRTGFPLDVEIARRPLSPGFTLAVRGGGQVPADEARRMAWLVLQGLSLLADDPGARYPAVADQAVR